MSILVTTAGSRLFIGPPKTSSGVDFTAADFASITGTAWVEIQGLTNLGGAGDSAELVTSNQIGVRRTRKGKGTRNAGSMAVVADFDAADPGQLAIISAEKVDATYAFRVVLDDASQARTSNVTMTIASPGVVSWNAHGLALNDAVVFASNGALPTGLVAGTTYYVKALPDANSFTVAATSGGAAIATSGTQSGTHTVTTKPTNSERLFVGLVMEARESYEQANNVLSLNATIEIDSNMVRVPPTGV